MVDRVQGSVPNLGMSPYTKSQPLTEEQKTEVQSILSKYDPKTVTSADAKAIFDAFRAANLQPGSDLRDAIKTAGFNPAQLRSQAVRQGNHGHHAPGKTETSDPVPTAPSVDISA